MLAGFSDDRADEGPSAGPASLAGLELARANGWKAPAARPALPRLRLQRWEGELMVDTLTPVLSDNWDADRSWTLSSYEIGGGYKALKSALGQGQDDIIQQVKDSGLRGRGGAGFPTGMKWGFIPQGDGKPHYLVVNADESEPGTCKDIPLMMANPHVLVEGVIISSYAIRANHAFIYCRGEVLHVDPPPAASGRGGLPRRPSGQEHPRLGLRPRPDRACRRRRLHLRRGDGAARLARGPPRPASAASAVPGRRRPVRIADGDQQRRVDRLGAVDHRQRRRTGSPGWAPRRARASASSRCPVTSPSRASTKRRSASPCASCSTSPAASATAAS